jgi:hypothetical protein
MTDLGPMPQATCRHEELNPGFSALRARQANNHWFVGYGLDVSSLSNAKEALERDVERVRNAWDDSQADRRRDAIYGYLKAVYDLVSWWSAEGCGVHRARQALRSRGLVPWPREDVYAAIIRCTADPARADKRTRSKWSRVLRYVRMEKDEKEGLAEFVKRKGGINDCNARYGRCLRRLAARRRSIAQFQWRLASKRPARIRGTG